MFHGYTGFQNQKDQFLHRNPTNSSSSSTVYNTSKTNVKRWWTKNNRGLREDLFSGPRSLSSLCEDKRPLRNDSFRHVTAWYTHSQNSIRYMKRLLINAAITTADQTLWESTGQFQFIYQKNCNATSGFGHTATPLARRKRENEKKRTHNAMYSFRPVKTICKVYNDDDKKMKVLGNVWRIGIQSNNLSI